MKRIITILLTLLLTINSSLCVFTEDYDDIEITKNETVEEYLDISEKNALNDFDIDKDNENNIVDYCNDGLEIDAYQESNGDLIVCSNDVSFLQELCTFSTNDYSGPKMYFYDDNDECVGELHNIRYDENLVKEPIKLEEVNTKYQVRIGFEDLLKAGIKAGTNAVILFYNLNNFDDSWVDVYFGKGLIEAPEISAYQEYDSGDLIIMFEDEDYLKLVIETIDDHVYSQVVCVGYNGIPMINNYDKTKYYSIEDNDDIKQIRIPFNNLLAAYIEPNSDNIIRIMNIKGYSDDICDIHFTKGIKEAPPIVAYQDENTGDLYIYSNDKDYLKTLSTYYDYWNYENVMCFTTPNYLYSFSNPSYIQGNNFVIFPYKSIKNYPIGKFNVHISPLGYRNQNIEIEFMEIINSNQTWSYDENKKTLTISCNGEMCDCDWNNRPWEEYINDIEIIIIDKGVTSIGDYAFANCSSLTSIIIPNTVTSIGEYAFFNCNSLSSIEISNYVTSIKKDAFAYCSSLKTISIPSSVTYIGEEAFTGCTSLKSIVVDSKNKFYDSRNNCNAIIETSTDRLMFGCNNSKIPNNIKHIGDYAFQSCNSLTSITIPNTVISIGKSAFVDCSSLISIYIPSSVTSIGETVLSMCPSLESIIVDSLNPIYDSRNNSNAIIETSTNKLIQGCNNTIIPNTVTSIGFRAFCYCDLLDSISISNSITSIESEAFCYCSSLNSVYIPSSVTHIEIGAFFNCSSETKIYTEVTSDYAGWDNEWNSNGLGGYYQTIYSCSYENYLKAINKEEKYSITFDGNGATSGTMSGMQNLQYGIVYCLNSNNYERDNYSFIEWNTKADGSGDSYFDNQVISNLKNRYNTSNITLYAKWKQPYDHIINYDLDGGINNANNVDGYNDEDVANKSIKLYAPTKLGYTFKNWLNIDTNKAISSFTSKDTYEEYNIKAIYTENKYKVVYNLNGGKDNSKSIPKTTTYTYTELDNVYVSNVYLNKPGYNFVGYSLDKKATTVDLKQNKKLLECIDISNYKNGATITLYAVYEPIVYTMKINYNGGTLSQKDIDAGKDILNGLDSGEINYGILTPTIKLPTLSKPGYKFKGFYSDVSKADGTITYNKKTGLVTPKKYTSISKYYTDISLDAIFEPITYKISYTTNSGKITSLKNTYNTTYNVDTTNLVLPEASRTGYKFDGWYTSYTKATKSTPAQFLNKVETIDDLVTYCGYTNSKLYAKWVLTDYDITLDYDGGLVIKGTQYPTSFTYTIEDNISLPTLSKPGYKFLGWYSDISKADGSITYNKDNTIKQKKYTSISKYYTNIDLYAKFESLKYTISFNANGGKGSMTKQIFEYDPYSLVTLNPNGFTKDNYNYIKWNTKKDGKGVDIEDKQSIVSLINDINTTSTSITLYAIWNLDLNKLDDTYNGAYYDDPISFDYTSNNNSLNIDVIQNCVEGLLTYDSNGLLAPGMANSWSSNKDCDIWTFNLRNDAYWVDSNGNQYAKVLARDFVTGFNRAKNGDSYIMDLFSFVENVYTSGDYTVIYELNKSVPYFENIVTYPEFYPVNKEFLEYCGTNYGSVNPKYVLSNSAYYFASYTKGSKIVLKKNNQYWDLDSVYLNTINLIHCKDYLDEYNMFKKGSIDSINANIVNGSLANELKTNYSDNYYVDSKSNVTYWASLNINRRAFSNYNNSEVLKSKKTYDEKMDTKKALLNANFRKAIISSISDEAYNLVNIDEEYANALDHNTFSATGIFEVDNKEYIDEVEKQLRLINGYNDINLKDGQDAYYNVTKAKDFLDKAKKELGNSVSWPIKLDIVSTTRTYNENLYLRTLSIEKSIEEALGKDNVDVLINYCDNSTEYYDAFYSVMDGEDVNADIVIGLGWGPDYKDPSCYLDLYDPADGMMLYSIGINSYNTDTSDDDAKEAIRLLDYGQMLDDANKTLDLNERNKKYAQAEAYLLSLGIIRPMNTGNSYVGVSRVVPYSACYSSVGWGSYSNIPLFKGMKVYTNRYVSSDEFYSAKDNWR